MSAPLILTSPSTQQKGVEFADSSISLSNQYSLALARAGGLPWVAPCITSKELIAESVSRADGVLLTGGDDIQPELYASNLDSRLRATVDGVDPVRDLFELMLIEEVFRQNKPLLAICRGHQLLNIAFGGTLIVDLPIEKPEGLNHRQMDRKNECVHEVELTPGSHLSKITGETEFGVNSSHHQAIGRLAAPFQVSARSSDGVIEAMELKANASQSLPFFMAVQYHPERLFDRYAAHMALFKAFVSTAAACSRKI
jgi:putative glutamine amidotransferase